MTTERKEIAKKLLEGNAHALTGHEIDLIVGALEFADWAHTMYETLNTQPPLGFLIGPPL